jgi:hypothetical protein
LRFHHNALRQRGKAAMRADRKQQTTAKEQQKIQRGTANEQQKNSKKYSQETARDRLARDARRALAAS